MVWFNLTFLWGSLSPCDVEHTKAPLLVLPMVLQTAAKPLVLTCPTLEETWLPSTCMRDISFPNP